MCKHFNLLYAIIKKRSAIVACCMKEYPVLNTFFFEKYIFILDVANEQHVGPLEGLGNRQ